MASIPETPAPEPAKQIELIQPPLKAAEIARAWGCSRAYVSKKIKAGCPTDSLEAARAWRVKHAVRGIGFRSKGSKLEAEIASEAPAPIAEKGGEVAQVPKGEGGGPALRSKDLATIEDSLAAAIEVEQEAHRLVIEAQLARNDEILAIRIAAYSKALDGRLSSEEKVQKFKERQGVLVTMDFAKQLIRRAWVPLLTRLRSIPKRAAVKANPHDDVHAEQVISIEIEDAIREARGAFAAESAPALTSGAAGEATLT
ncbi:MAG: hypothetical protein QOE70_936 [Chthoniobacter sp.]|jgi:hypothetical protein|nr:hypothetical protein [Chthoniobacter sp.]